MSRMKIETKDGKHCNFLQNILVYFRLHLVSKHFDVPIDALGNSTIGDIFRLARRIEILTSGNEFLPNKSGDLNKIDQLKYDFRCFFLTPPVEWYYIIHETIFFILGI